MLLVQACAEPDLVERGAAFVHEFDAGPTPWSHDRFDDEAGKFTFAIFSDLNGGERPGVFDVAVAELALLRPELIMSVGDLIDGGTEDRAQLAREWDDFDARASKSIAPVFHVGGNHDLTNQVMRDVWTERYGQRYYHFVYKDVLFLILDTEDYSDDRMREIYEARAAALEVGAGPDPEAALAMEYYRMPERITGEVGSEQSEYVRAVLATYPDVRWTFLFMHKPVWLRDDEPDFAAIEDALTGRPYTLFNGHLHNFGRTTKHGRDYITLGTTGGSQNRNSEDAFDHVTLVTVAEDGPTIGHIRLDGMRDIEGDIPAGGDSLCFQASICGRGR